MILNALSHMQDIGVLPAIALSIFFVFFVSTLAWVTRLDKNHLHAMEQLPLDKGNADHE